MDRNGNSISDLFQMGELELSILLAIRRAGVATVNGLRDMLGGHCDGMTLRSALRKLEDQGQIMHTIEYAQFVYRPIPLSRRRGARTLTSLSVLGAGSKDVMLRDTN
jgi:hypothetical protein